MTDRAIAYPKIDPADPVFISYRQSDGTAITTDLSWLLRAVGIPVWRDRDDLPPGDTKERLAQAIDEGLSGGVLVVTQDIANSDIVKSIEAPKLVDLHEKHSEFALAITNAVERQPGKLDYDAPDRLLGFPAKTLASTDQKPVDAEGLRALVRGLLWHRIAEHRTLVAANKSTFSLSVQTRNVAQVYDRTGAQLDIRIRPSAHERLPDPDGLRDLARVIGFLPDAVTRSGASRIRIAGGAHLSVAFALGAALPSSRFGQLEVVDQREQTWQAGGEPGLSATALLRVESSNTAGGGAGRSRTGGAGVRPTVAVYLDLLDVPSDAAFERFVDEHEHGLNAWEHLKPGQSGRLDPSVAGALASEAAARIRALSGMHSNAVVHLLLRCPFPIAVLVGRLANTLRVTTYEWDDSDPDAGNDFRPRFVPSMEVRASVPHGVITSVVM